MSRVRRFTENQIGRDLIVGDIHGCFTRLEKRLGEIGFSPEKGDRLFSVGDLVDRGPESEKSLEWISKPWFYAVSGNHEDMAIRWPNGFMDAGNYLANGGGWNLSNPPDVQKEFSEAFKSLPIAMEIETKGGIVGVVHADCPFGNWSDFVESLNDEQLKPAMRERIIDAAQWSRDRITSLDEGIVEEVRAVVVGHTPMQNPTTLGNVHYIDTMGWRNGVFTILDAATLRPA